jgi:Uma2 family endonuclease
VSIFCYFWAMSHTFRQNPTATTLAAEGLPRRRWTIGELEELSRHGVFGGIDREHERFELIGGEIVPMSPKGNRHENVRTYMAHTLSRMSPEAVWVSSEPQFNLADDLYTVPDILVHPADVRVYDVRGATALLVIEIADSSWDYDTGRKLEIYAAHGVREYWVIDAEARTTRVHRGPTGSTYADRLEIPASGQLRSLLVGELAISLATLVD